jgi:hypothetical protein
MRTSTPRSFPRKRESSFFNQIRWLCESWLPAYAGMSGVWARAFVNDGGKSANRVAPKYSIQDDCRGGPVIRRAGRDWHMPREQLDLFGEEPEFSDEDYKPVTYSSDPEEVRRELNRLLDEARSAKVFPWEPRKVGLYRTIFPQMANWLPKDEAEQLCFAFEEEMRRLEAA